MARRDPSFICQNCGAAYNRWQGKCEACGAWIEVWRVSETTTAGGEPVRSE